MLKGNQSIEVMTAQQFTTFILLNFYPLSLRFPKNKKDKKCLAFIHLLT